MDIFSIELAAERIYDSRTREYFREVFNSYTNGNYRSAVVMLWSVVVCDLVYKLQHLRDIYNDTTAGAILDGIMEQQEANRRSPDWEMHILTEVRDRTELIDNAEYESLGHLQKERHLSAHPILSNVDLLFTPNRDTVRALIRNALECILLKPPILSQKITTALVVDLADKKDILVDDDSLRRYLESKYLRNLHPAIENRLFRDLWKFVFRLSNPEAEENRTINYRALCIMFTRRRMELQNFIRSQPDYFSDIGGESEQLQLLVDFLNGNQSVYQLLTEAARVAIQTFAEQDVATYATAYFLSDEICSHLHQLNNRVAAIDEFITSYGQEAPSDEAWRNLLTRAEESNCLSIALDIAIEFHSKSGNYNFADVSFSRFVEPSLGAFSKEQLIRLLEQIDTNQQAYGRRRAKTDYEKLYEQCIQNLGPNFDFEQYANLYPRIKHLIEAQEEDDIPF